MGTQIAKELFAAAFAAILNRLKIVFLGTGTSTGVPAIGCDCAVCLSADPLNKRYRSSIFVESDDLSLVVDTTPDFRSQCLRANINKLDGVIYTHEHSDHLLGLDDLRRFCLMHNKRIPVYGSSRVNEYIRRIFPYAVRQPAPYKGLPEVELHEINGPFQVGHLRVIPYSMPHGSTTALGFRFDDARGPRFAYLTDCKEVSPEIRRDVREIPLLILDALREKSHPTHLSLDEAIAVVKDTRPGQTLFTHIAHEMDHRGINARLPAGIALAYDGQIVEA